MTNTRIPFLRTSVADRPAAARVKLSPLAAATADQRNYVLLREIKARCERMGFPLNLASDKPIDLMAMDAAFDGKDVIERLRIKTALKSLHLI